MLLVQVQAEPWLRGRNGLPQIEGANKKGREHIRAAAFS
jgi:hypothetical protein